MNETAETHEKKETPETTGKQEVEHACACGKDPMHCLERTIHENPMRAMWWAMGLGFLAGWKVKSCLHSLMPRRS